jgi:beta-galactosidase
MKPKFILLLFLSIAAFSQTCFGQFKRFETDLSKNDWKICLDTHAAWINDKLFLPPVDLKSLPVNKPGEGWQMLEKEKSVVTHLPATVEEYFWGENGNSFGLSGNYLGVSWFTTNVEVPANLRGKRITLQFESVRFRAEVFINQKLAGYDIVNSTPFEVDITDFVDNGKSNKVAVRITDSNGNFDWRDSKNFMWGNYRTIPSHGFGGITGKVKLVATDKVFIQDVFIKNKPNPKEIELTITMVNGMSKETEGICGVEITEFKEGGKIIFKNSIPMSHQLPGTNKHAITLPVDNAKLWSVDEPNLYYLKVIWKGKDKTNDEYVQRFGFRWFGVKDVDGDKQFYLNGKRIVLRTAISWGFWPINGIQPSDELARKQIEIAKKIGLNMLNFHRLIGNTNVMDYADELGLLYFEEPGGYQFPYELFTPKDSLEKSQRDFYVQCRREKLFRMIKRDRNHPSVIIYNLHNERQANPCYQDSTDIRDAHALDESRIIVYNSNHGEIKMGPDIQYKLNMMPYDQHIYDYGWFDQHHAGGPGVYHNSLYNGPKDYLRYTDHKDEIIYWGEEGAIGTPPRLQLIHNEILKLEKKIGWESDNYLKWYDAYDSFLKESGFKKWFKDVDALTTAMGDVAYYYQGRIIENIRINNISDGYAVNGWESMILENHSGIVDNYRNPKTDRTELISNYTKPLVLSVKTNRKVVGMNDTSKVDFHIINEVNLNGNYQLSIKGTDAKGEIFTKDFPVKISGGSTYGELLFEGLKILPRVDGYLKVTAELKDKNKLIISGSDDIYVVSIDTKGIPADGMVADSNGVIAKYLKSLGINSFKEYKSGIPRGKYLLVGEFNPPVEKVLATDVLEWVNEGNTLIVVNNSVKWAEYLAQKEVLDYRGFQTLGKVWYGGNYFVKEHELFSGLPQVCVFNWEYQCFALYNKNRLGLRLFNGETIVGCVSDHKKEVYSALSVIPHGRGKIILCALDMISCLKDLKPLEIKLDAEGANAAMKDLSSTQYNTSNVVAQKLLLNMLRSANK